MGIKYKFKNVHSCEAVVLTCIDFRFWRETVEFVEKELRVEDFDFPSLPGSAKAINDCVEEEDLALSCIGVSCDLHHAKKIVIVNHEDCGAYGGSAKFGNDQKKEQEFHEEELRKAKKKLIDKYPEKEYILVFAKLANNGEEVEFVKL